MINFNENIRDILQEYGDLQKIFPHANLNTHRRIYCDDELYTRFGQFYNNDDEESSENEQELRERCFDAFRENFPMSFFDTSSVCFSEIVSLDEGNLKKWRDCRGAELAYWSDNEDYYIIGAYETRFFVVSCLAGHPLLLSTSAGFANSDGSTSHSDLPADFEKLTAESVLKLGRTFMREYIVNPSH